MERVETESKKVRKPGRPRAIPLEMEGVVVNLYRQEYGYRAIARILRQEYGLNPHYSSIRKTLIRLGEVKDNTHENLS